MDNGSGMEYGGGNGARDGIGGFDDGRGAGGGRGANDSSGAGGSRGVGDGWGTGGGGVADDGGGAHKGDVKCLGYTAVDDNHDRPNKGGNRGCHGPSVFLHKT